MDPLVNHVVCDLWRQRRLYEARREAFARAAAAPSFLDRVLRRGRPSATMPQARGVGEDVWHALRF